MLNKLYPPLSSELRTRIVTLWSVLLIGSLVVGGIAAYMGNFVRGNVADQLSSQQIVFTAAADLKPEEKAEDACLTQYAGSLMVTGDQARCYANHFIGLHTRDSAIDAGFPGATYATLGGEQTKLRASIAAAQTAGATPDAIKALNDKLTAAGNLRTTMQTSSTLRGQLLNAWGWDTFGIGILVAGVALIAIALVFGSALVYELRTKASPEEDQTLAGRAGGLAAAAR